MTSRDVEALRDIGLTDGEILDVCQVTAYYNYVNRLADGLGVELEDYWARLRAP
jgi:alkylhydroperoxidase family enzyme